MALALVRQRWSRVLMIRLEFHRILQKIFEDINIQQGVHMTNIDWKRKLSSRKLWAAIAGIITGLAMVFGLDENTISTVAGAVVSVASVAAYIMAEGKVDAESVKNAAQSVQNAVEEVQDDTH